MGLAGCTIAVLGMARTGRATAAALSGRGAKILAYDERSIEPDPEIREMMNRGLTLHCGPDFPGLAAADLVIPSPGMRADAPALLDCVSRHVPVLSEVEVAYRISPAPLVAFTGTNGKSTTTALCGHMLRSSGIAAFVGGNLAPGTPLVQLANAAASGDVLVAEISSFQLEWVDEFRPGVASILNVSEEHLDRHAGVYQYAATKARIAARQGWTDLAIYGDPFAEAFPELLAGDGRHQRFSPLHPVESGAYIDGARMRVVGRLDASEGSLPDISLDLSKFVLEGQHNQENAMAAALAALEMGARPEAIEKALRSFKGLPHRMETVGVTGGVRYINNSMCTNPAASLASLGAIRGGVVVITGGRSKGLDMRPFAIALADRDCRTILIGEMAGEMARYLTDAGSRSFEIVSGMAEAVETAARLARPGETVVLLPGFSSFDMFRDFEARGQSFRDAVAGIGDGQTRSGNKEHG